MPEELAVKATVDENKILLLTISYGDELMLRRGAADDFKRELVSEYKKNQRGTDQPSCVVVIEPDVAGSPLVRGLYELHKRVVANRGRLVVVGYPPEFFASLTTLGLTALEGFYLMANHDDALLLLEE